MELANTLKKEGSEERTMGTKENWGKSEEGESQR